MTEYNKEMSKSNYTAIILEEMRDNFRIVIEAVGQIQDTIKTLATKADLKIVSDDVKIIKLTLTDTNKDVKDHNRRIARLENAVLPAN